MTVDDLKSFLVLHGVTPQSMQIVETKLSRWVDILLERGVTELPELHLSRQWTEAQYQAWLQVMALFTGQAQSLHKPLKIPRELERVLAERAHEYRDLSGIRELGEPDE